MALCPKCGQEINGSNIRKEQISGAFKPVHMWYCPRCGTILGITQSDTMF